MCPSEWVDKLTPVLHRYLCLLAHFQICTDGVKSSCSTDVHVGLVEGLQHPDVVRTLFLQDKYNKTHE